MKKGMVLYPVLLFCVASCRNHDDTMRSRLLHLGLEQAGTVLKEKNMLMCMDLVDKLHQPDKYYHAETWQPKAAFVQHAADSAIDYINALQADLRKEARPAINNTMGTMNEEDEQAVVRLFEKQGKAALLHQRLVDFTEKAAGVLNPDEFSDNPILQADLRRQRDSLFKSSYAWQRTTGDNPIAGYFQNINAIGAMAMLSKLKNDVALTENNIISYCHSSVGTRHRCESYVPLVLQNSSYLKAGQELEIKAGIGEFSYAPRPRIIIDGKKIPFQDDGLAVYKTTVIGKPGKYFISLRVEYDRPDGVVSTLTKKLEYIIAE